MYAVFGDSTGWREALILAIGENRLRLTIRGSQDAIELENLQGQWFIDKTRPAQIAFLMMEMAWSDPWSVAMKASAGRPN